MPRCLNTFEKLLLLTAGISIYITPFYGRKRFTLSGMILMASPPQQATCLFSDVYILTSSVDPLFFFIVLSSLIAFKDNLLYLNIDIFDNEAKINDIKCMIISLSNYGVVRLSGIRCYQLFDWNTLFIFHS